MKPSKAAILLSVLTGVLALIQSGLGLFWRSAGAPFPFTTLHGEVVQMAGTGIYRFDTYFKAPILRGTDAVTLFVCIPLLVVALLSYRRGSLRGGLFLAGVLVYFLYNAASVALGTAYNNLFLEYIAYFSASLFALVLTLRTIDAGDLAARLSPGVPRRGIAALLFVAGLALLFAWVGDIVSPLLQGGVPAIASYTTEVTYVFDLGIIAPLAFLSGVLILRREPVGYLVSTILLIVLAIVGLMVASQTAFQLSAGIALTPAQFIGKAGSFILLALFSGGLILRFMRCVPAKLS